MSIIMTLSDFAQYIHVAVEFLTGNTWGKLIILVPTLLFLARPFYNGFIWLVKKINSGRVKHRLPDSAKAMLRSVIADMSRYNRFAKFDDAHFVELELEATTRLSDALISPKCAVVKAVLANEIYNQADENSSLDRFIYDQKSKSFSSFGKAVRNSGFRAIVLGAPGSGKSVAVRNYVINLARSSLEGMSRDFPIYLQLSGWTPGPDGRRKGFEEFLEFEIENNDTYLHLRNSQWRQHKDELFLVLDGVDELSRQGDDFEFYTDEIARWFDKNDVRVIYTCRVNDYNEKFKVSQILIRPFTGSQISKFLKHRFPGDYRLFESALLDNPSIYEMCSSPFILDLVCFYRENHQKKATRSSVQNEQPGPNLNQGRAGQAEDDLADSIPENLSTLFKNIFLTVFFREQDKGKQISEEGVKRTILALEKLAHLMKIGLRLNSLPWELIDQHGLAEYRPEFEFCIQSGLLNLNKATGEISFAHNRYLEFFCASLLAQNIESSKNASTLPEDMFSLYSWREMVLLTAQMMNDPGPLLAALNEAQKDEKAPDHVAFYRKLLTLECCLLTNTQGSTALLADLARQYRDQSIKIYEIISLISVLKKYIANPDCKEALLGLSKSRDGYISSEAFTALTSNFQGGFSLLRLINFFWRFWMDGQIFSCFSRMVNALRIYKIKHLGGSILLSFIVILLFLLQLLALYIVMWLGFNVGAFIIISIYPSASLLLVRLFGVAGVVAYIVCAAFRNTLQLVNLISTVAFFSLFGFGVVFSITSTNVDVSAVISMIIVMVLYLILSKVLPNVNEFYVVVFASGGAVTATAIFIKIFRNTTNLASIAGWFVFAFLLSVVVMLSLSGIISIVKLNRLKQLCEGGCEDIRAMLGEEIPPLIAGEIGNSYFFSKRAFSYILKLFDGLDPADKYEMIKLLVNNLDASQIRNRLTDILLKLEKSIQQ